MAQRLDTFNVHFNLQEKKRFRTEQEGMHSDGRRGLEEQLGPVALPPWRPRQSEAHFGYISCPVEVRCCSAFLEALINGS